MPAPPRILVVDDDVEFAELVGEYLRGRGAEVFVARTVAGGADVLVSERIDVLILDLQVAEGDAGQLLRFAREREPMVPAVVVARRGAVEAAVQALRAGAHDYLVKPLQLRELYQAVQAAISRSVREREQRWMDDAMAMLLCAELAESPQDAEACVHPAVDLLRRLPRADRVEVVDAEDGAVPTRAGRIHAFGPDRGLLLDPDLPQARAVVLAVHRAILRSRGA